MRPKRLSIFLALLILLPWSVQPRVNIPDDINFNVYRNSSLIGFHNLSFSQIGDDIKAEIEIKFEVTFLGFVVYDYYHKNIEVWSEDWLAFLKSMKRIQKGHFNLKTVKSQKH